MSGTTDIKTTERIKPFAALGQWLRDSVHKPYDAFSEVMARAEAGNPWFTQENQLNALDSLGRHLLQAEALESWLAHYPLAGKVQEKTVGVIMPGNLPAAGFFDLLCVLSAGHSILMKLSRDDTVLMQWLAGKLQELSPELDRRIRFAERLTEADRYIGTGSDNSARYFDYYFRGKPHLIRRNRNSVAVLTGDETESDLQKLGQDIFSYFGKGCRSVSKLFVPAGYDFSGFFRAMTTYASVLQHNKYMNNHDYYRTVYLMNKRLFLTNDFLMVTEDSGYASPVSVVYFEYYQDIAGVTDRLQKDAGLIQCVAGKAVPGGQPLGTTQQPGLSDYADGRDTMAFLLAQD